MLHGNKDAPNQNFIVFSSKTPNFFTFLKEIYVNKKNVNELSQDEALARYKKNVRFFAYFP